MTDPSCLSPGPTPAGPAAVVLALMVPARLSVEEARAQQRIAEAMAQTMIDMAALHGACDIHHLSMTGWSAAEIVEYEAEARRIAGGATVSDIRDDMIDLPHPREPEPEAA
jgi:hypothetical protein